MRRPIMRTGLTEHRGFTMIELLVGMLIAMLATIVIMQVYEAFEGQKRTTTGGADAQTNGSVALYNIQREVALGGYGLPTFIKPCAEGACGPICTGPLCSSLLCEPVPTIDHDGNVGTPESGIFPVLINDGGVGPGASDTIIVTYGDTETGGVPTISDSVVGNTALVTNNMACTVGSIALLVKGSACDLERVAGVTGTTGITFQGIPTVNTATPATHPQVGVTCLGQLNETSFSVISNALTRNGIANVAGVVNLQAQYGISATPGDNTVTRWVDGVDIAGTENFSMTKVGDTLVTPPLNAVGGVFDRLLIKAIRVAVVARSGLWEKDLVSQACSSTTTPNPTGVCAWEGNPVSPAPVIDLSNDPEWQHYRYKVFEVTIPLRNVIWSFQAVS
ncbi:MAG: PilW family protein [Pseudomonadota bacterium]